LARRTHPPQVPTPRQLEYRDKTYVVVPSTSGGWNWAVDLDARTVRGGQAASEQAAIEAAERMIDGALAPWKRRLRLVGSSPDGSA
jgi:hypothetical protein